MARLAELFEVSTDDEHDELAALILDRLIVPKARGVGAVFQPDLAA